MKKRKNAASTRTVTKKNIIDGLRRLGLRSGDHVLVHISLSSFGRVAGGADTVIDALLKVTGPDGTVAVPAFGSQDKVFDPAKSETGLDTVPQTLRKRKDAVGSRHPLASVAAIGRKAQWLIENHAEAKTAHGRGTPYHKLYELGGKVLLLGVDQDRSTFLHTVEALARLPYLRPAKASYIDSTGKKKTKTWPFFAGPHRNFIGLQKWLEKTRLTRKTNIGPCVAQLMPCRELLDALLERLETEPALFISDNPNLPDGIRQKADVLRDQWRRCSFRLVADSRFAGQYAEEIIDNLTRFGIEHILLSYVNDRPWNHIEQRKRKWYIQGLRRAKISVSAIKATGVLPSEQAASLMREAGTDTLIVPSTYPADAIARFAAGGFKVLVENTFIGGKDMGDMLEALLQKISGNVQIAFNPLGFVRVGENPFLTSFRSRIKRHIGLLYVNDGFATSRRTALEEGLSEIKELISALHCKGFGGLFAMQAPGPAAFPQTMRKFMDILEETGVWRI